MATLRGISAKDSTKYEDGFLELTFTIRDHRSKLEDVITNTNLGELEDNNLPTVKAAIDVKYPGLTSEVGITVVVNANNTATIIAKDATKYQDGSVVVNFTIKDHRLKLSDVITNADLGKFRNTTEAAAKINFNWGMVNGVDGITITFNTTARIATITAKDSATYQDGSINLGYTIDTDRRLRMDEVIKVKDLGEFRNTTEISTKLSLEHGLINGLNGIHITFDTVNHTVTVTARNSLTYQDSTVVVTYSIRSQNQDQEPEIESNNKKANLVKATDFVQK